MTGSTSTAAAATSTSASSTMASMGSMMNMSASLSGIVGIAASFLMFHLGAKYVQTDGLTPIFYAYGGDLMALVMSQMAAAYAIVKTIDSSVHTTGRFFYQQRGFSSIGDYMGVYELLAVLGFLTWGLLISIIGYIEAALMWAKFDEMQANNVTMTQIHGYKFLALGFIVGVGAWISGLTLGESCPELLGFFDNYDLTKEGYDENLKRDDDGRSITYDLSYHVITTIYTYFLVSVIALGSFIFGFVFLGTEVE